MKKWQILELGESKVKQMMDREYELRGYTEVFFLLYNAHNLLMDRSTYV